MNRNFYMFRLSFLFLLASIFLAATLLRPVSGLCMDIVGDKDAKPAQQTEQVPEDKPKGKTGIMKGSGLDSPIKDKDGRVMYYIRLSDVSYVTINNLISKGAVIRHIAEQYKTITVFAEPDKVDALRDIPEVLNIQQAEKPMTN